MLMLCSGKGTAKMVLTADGKGVPIVAPVGMLWYVPHIYRALLRMPAYKGTRICSRHRCRP